MICPKCKTRHKCTCPTCIEGNKKTAGYFLVLEGDLGVCQNCGYKFEGGESMDAEWDEMISDMMVTSMTKNNLIEYLEIRIKKNRSEEVKFLKRMSQDYEGDSFIHNCFYNHFGITFSEALKSGEEGWIKSYKRNLKIENLTTNK